MLSEKHIFHEKYHNERSAELVIACDITPCSISAVFYDLALERRYARSVMFGADVSAQNALEELERLLATAAREYSVKGSAIKRVGIAAPVHIETAIERLTDDRAVFVPYISAGISGRFTASLLTLPEDGDLTAAELGGELCLAIRSGGELRCAAFPLAGAFDGSAVENGMPSENGAADAVRIEKDGVTAYEVVGDAEGVGVSPCGLLTLTAQMRRRGILDGDGIMTDRDMYYIGEDLFVTQNDIRAVQTDKARLSAALELLPGTGGNMYFSGEPFSDARGFRALLELGAIPRRFETASFCRNSTEQGIIAFLSDEAARDRAFELSRSAKDVTQDNLLKFDEICLNNILF